MRDIIAILMLLIFLGRNVSVYSQSTLLEPDNHARFFSKTTSKNQIDVKFYSLQVYIDTQNKSIAGICEIYFIISTQSKNVNFDFTNQFQINKILDKDGNIINFSHKNDKIIITGKDFNSLDSLNYLAIYYNGTPKEASEPPWDGGFIWEEKVPFVGITCQLEGASIWWPCNDRWDDKPDSMSINVIVPDSLMAISNGVLRGIDKYSPTETIYNWFVQYPIQTYNVTLYVGDFYNFSYLYFS